MTNKLNREDKPKLYLSAKVSPEYHLVNKNIERYFKDFQVILPQEIVPPNIPHEKLSLVIARECFKLMNSSDLVVLVPPYGRDCSLEVGFCYGINKPVFYIPFNRDITFFVRDWMLKEAFTRVIAPGKELYNHLIQIDPVLEPKVTYVSDLKQISPTLLSLYKKWRLENGS